MVISALGIVDYGVFNVVAGFVSMAGFFNVTLASSLQRFYSFERSHDGVIHPFCHGDSYLSIDGDSGTVVCEPCDGNSGR